MRLRIKEIKRIEITESTHKSHKSILRQVVPRYAKLPMITTLRRALGLESAPLVGWCLHNLHSSEVLQTRQPIAMPCLEALGQASEVPRGFKRSWDIERCFHYERYVSCCLEDAFNIAQILHMQGMDLCFCKKNKWKWIVKSRSWKLIQTLVLLASSCILLWV